MISVVIPAYNEQGAITEAITRLRSVLERAEITPFEIIVVDDGSSDRTGGLAIEAGARAVRHPHNIGYGRSIMDGIRAASHDMIVITDADGTYEVEKIPDLVAKYREGFDMVVAARTGKHYNESPLKYLLRLILKAIVEYVAGRSIPDINSGLRVFSKTTSMKFFHRLCDRFSFTTSLTLAYMMNGQFVDYIESKYHERIGKSKVRLLKDSVSTFQYILEAVTYYNPLKIFTLLSFLCIMFAGLVLCAALLFQLFSLFMLGVGSILVAMLILALGLLAVLLKQIMDRP